MFRDGSHFTVNILAQEHEERGVRLTARSARRLRLVDVVLRDCELSGADLTEAREILGVAATASREEIQAAYARLIRAVHPDAGGSAGLAARINAARDRLLKK